MRWELERDFIIEKVEGALKQMSALKSPGLDSFGAGFFQKHWGAMGKEVVCLAVLSFLNGGPMPKGLNHTHRALIPR